MSRRRVGNLIVDDETGETFDAKGERFIKSMVGVWRELNKANYFKPAEEKTLHRLSMFLQMNTNAIVKNSEYLTIERMADETGMDRSNLRKVIKGLMRKNAIGKWSSGEREVYYINPILYRNGDVPRYLFYLFDDEYFERSRQEDIQPFKIGKKPTSLIAL